MNANPRSRRRALPASVVLTLLALLIAGLLLASAGCVSATDPLGAIASSGPQPTDEQALEAPASQPADEQALEAYGKLPLSFVPNEGQVAEEQVRYHAQGAGFGFFFTPTGAMLSFVGENALDSSEAADLTEEKEPAAARGFALALNFLEANPEAEIGAREELPGKVNYLRGPDPAEHRTDLPTYGELVYEGLWPGVDMAVRGEEGALKYEFLVEPGASVEDIGLAYRGAEGLSLDEEGNLKISTALGELTDTAPVSYQEVDGERVPVESRYVLDEGAGRYGFEVGAGYDPARPLVIDPGLTYSTFLGGGKGDFGYDIAVDEGGNAYVTGYTVSADWFATLGAFDTSYNDSGDAFVVKLSEDGNGLNYSTFLGGAGHDHGSDIAVDRYDNAYVTGSTRSADYPTTTSAFDTTHNGNWDAFVTKLEADGAGLAYSTFLGGADIDHGTGIAVDQNDRAYVAGETRSAGYPTTPGAFDTTPNGSDDAFVTKLNAAGSSLAYSTLIGGIGAEQAFGGIAVDQNGRAYLTGRTSSAGYPTTPGAFDTTLGGANDAFVTKLNAAGSSLAYSTLIGGGDGEIGRSIAVDQNGRAYVTGETRSADYPTTPGAFDTTHNGLEDAFVTKLNESGSALAYSTFLGETSSDRGYGIAVDASGNAYVTGSTLSLSYPTTSGAFDTTPNGSYDAFVTKLDGAGSSLAYSTLIGGKEDDAGNGIAVDQNDRAYVAGQTSSAGYPITPGAFSTSFNGGILDAFVTKLPTD